MGFNSVDIQAANYQTTAIKGISLLSARYKVKIIIRILV